MKRILIGILLVGLVFTLSGCNSSGGVGGTTPKEYRNHVKTLSNKDGYEIRYYLGSSKWDSKSSYLLYQMDNETNLLRIDLEHLLQFEGSSVFGFANTSSGWERYRIEEFDDLFTSDDEILKEMAQHCEGEWSEDRSEPTCDIKVVADQLGDAIIDVIGQPFPEYPDRFAVGIMLVYNVDEEYISEVELDFTIIYNTYVNDHPSYSGISKVHLGFVPNDEININIPRSYEDVDDSLTFESFLRK